MKIILQIMGCILAIALFTGISWGEDIPLSLVQVSGNASSIDVGTNGTYLLSLDGVNQNATVTDSNYSSITVPLNKVGLSKIHNAALVMSKEGNKSVYMVMVSDPVYSAENQTMSATLSALKYYDGTLLSEYEKTKTELIPGKFSTTDIYLETPIKKQNNECWCIPEMQCPPDC